MRKMLLAFVLALAAVLVPAASPAFAHDGPIGYQSSAAAGYDDCVQGSACTYLASGPSNAAAPAGGVLQSFTFDHDAMPAGTAQLLVFDDSGSNPVLVAESQAYSVTAAAAGTTTVPLPAGDQPHIDAGQVIGMTFTPTSASEWAPGLGVSTGNGGDGEDTCDGTPQMNQPWAPSSCVGSTDATIALSAYFYSDVRPPVVTAGSSPSGVGPFSATLHADVDPNGAPTTAHFSYGPTACACSSKTSDASVGNGSGATDFAQAVSGLSPSTTYYYKVIASNDPYGGKTTGPVEHFTTAPPPPEPDVVAGSASSPAEDGITLSGTVNPHSQSTSWDFEYGTDTSYGSHTAAQSIASSTGDQAVPVSARIDGLAPGTTYHWRLVATNSGGTARTADGTFATAPGKPPALASFQAQDLTTHSVHLHFTLDPNGYATTFEVEFGTTTAYGASGGQSGASAAARGPQGAFQDLTSLGAGTTYHWRVIAKNRWGTTVGPDETFTTLSPPVVTEDPAAQDLTDHSALLEGTVDPEGVATTEHFEYGTSTLYGERSADAAIPVDGKPVLVHFTPPDLAPGTVYHWRIVATSAGGTTAGPDHVLVTLPNAPAPPLHRAEVHLFDRYVHLIRRPEARVLRTGGSFDRSLKKASGDGRLTLGEQGRVTHLVKRYLHTLAKAAHALKKAHPTLDLASATKRELRRLKKLEKALNKLERAIHKGSARAYLHAYTTFLKAARKHSELTKEVDRKAADTTGHGVFRKHAKPPSLKSRAARALAGTWHGQQDGLTLTVEPNGTYTTSDGGGGKWRPTSDGIRFTGTESYDGGHATVKHGAMEFYWRNKDGSIDYFVYLKG